MTDPLITFRIPGRAAGKKTSGSIIFPGIMGMGLRRHGKPVRGMQDLLLLIAETKNPALAGRAASRAFPSIVPPKSHAKWLKWALKVMGALRCARPIVPEGHMVGVGCVVYMDRGQTGDLINFEEALWDALQEAGIIPTDHWINGHEGSERRWTDPMNPRMEVAVYDLGPRVEFELPKVLVKGLKATGGRPFHYHIEVDQVFGPFRIVQKTTRETLVMEADRVWRAKGLGAAGLPDGAIIHCKEGNTP